MAKKPYVLNPPLGYKEVIHRDGAGGFYFELAPDPTDTRCKHGPFIHMVTDGKGGEICRECWLEEWYANNR